ncbi:ComEA family DNA-binding protein [Glutamicibacter sp.]|uniref:ComEA family DNA-binding protein n=1 Tax=Glutamicibacter sp. TaxID=1931995 RepID=UPI0028BF32F5|nr:ComEA family DNA-binding protein [Glutamicibacter sp.]
MGRHDFFSRYAPRPSRLRFAVSRVAVFVLVLIVLGWIGLSILLAPPPKSTQLDTLPLVSSPSGTPAEESDPGRSATPAALTVHVVGAVKKPGVYQLAAGSRIVDAIAAAGGMTKRAVPERLNLAALLVDGQQVVLPGATATGGQGADAASESSGGKVSLNTADADALQELPGIGPSLAQRIIDFRTKNGPFTSVADLDAVSGIGPSILANLEGLAEP